MPTTTTQPRAALAQLVGGYAISQAVASSVGPPRSIHERSSCIFRLSPIIARRLFCFGCASVLAVALRSSDTYLISSWM